MIVKQKVRRNEQFPCSVRGCTHNRAKLSPRCSTHEARRFAWGSPEHGRRWLVRELRPWEEVARDFVQANESHPGITAAVEWFHERLEGAYRETGDRDARAALAHRLRFMDDLGVSATECLVRALSVWLFASSLPAQQATREVRDTNTAAHVLRAVRGRASGRTWARVRRIFGAEIAATCGFLFQRICDLRQEQFAQRGQIDRAVMSTPFVGQPASTDEVN